jgi:hypothetical protein
MVRSRACPGATVPRLASVRLQRNHAQRNFAAISAERITPSNASAIWSERRCRIPRSTPCVICSNFQTGSRSSGATDLCRYGASQLSDARTCSSVRGRTRAYSCAARMKFVNSGCGACGLLLNSGWN